MKRLILTLAVVALVVSAGCTMAANSLPGGTAGEESLGIEIVKDETWQKDALFSVSPLIHTFGRMRPNAEVSTWTEDGSFPLGPYKVVYHDGDLICIGVYNGKDNPMTYSITVTNAPEEINECKYTGQWYYRAPEEFIEVVSVSDTSITLLPGEVGLIYFSFVLPEIEYPSQWEFRINISETGVPVAWGYNIRMLFTMR